MALKRSKSSNTITPSKTVLRTAKGQAYTPKIERGPYVHGTDRGLTTLSSKSSRSTTSKAKKKTY